MKDIDINKLRDYESLIDTFEVDIIGAAHDDYYQGDSFYLLREGDRYGMLIFGWGSCSGCDEFEACYGDLKAMTALRDSLWAEVWWGTKEEVKNRYGGDYAQLQWYATSDTFQNFVKDVLSLME